MTEQEFRPEFEKLMQAYRQELEGVVTAAYYQQLKHLDLRDLRAALPKIIANEPATTWKPRPSAETIVNYTLDEQEARRLREQTAHEQTVTLETIHEQWQQTGDRTASECAFATLCVNLVKIGDATAAQRQQTIPLIEAFLDQHAASLPAETADWLQAKLRGVRTSTEYAHPAPPDSQAIPPPTTTPLSPEQARAFRLNAAIRHQMQGAYDRDGGATAYKAYKALRTRQTTGNHA